MTTPWYIVVNPVAGQGRAARLWKQIETALQELGFSYSVCFTQYRNHALQIVDSAVLKGFRHILGVGGDGTCHELVNGILRQPHLPSQEITFSMLPIGTGNDWARTYRIPSEPRERLRRLLRGEHTWQDVGKVVYRSGEAVVERYFANVAGMAYDAYIVQKTERRRFIANFHYLLAMAYYLFAFKPIRGRLQAAECTAEEEFYTINVGVCRFSGGGMQLVPHAVPNDGLLAVTYAPRLPKWEVLLQTPRFYRGTLLEHPHICSFQTTALRVEHLGETSIGLEADGEYLGETPASFSIEKNALRIAL
ncbi:MAG: diacylglycerol kinase family lipid kinase [Saprospiraceae bacterium]|nr:diacylglycerol kinase family lipid kinase [Saprospiraceae bacterium]MDW8483057.1 diacylglycerol kinase family lipid kinase [Saprospiraceae bacterium]